MTLPVNPPIAPMLARAAKAIPIGMHYEAKWDGFRAIIFRDGESVEIGSRNEKPMTRYFPELVAAARAQLPERCVVDGEIIIINGGKLDFEALQNRIHPADSRVKLLAQQTPANFVGFDLLALDDDDLMAETFRVRRAKLEAALAASQPPVHLAPATSDLATAQQWFEQFEGAGLDGVVAKPFDSRYEPNKRIMTKIKHERTADCVVAGFRWHKTGPIVGSLLLGLYDEEGKLHSVGVCASFTMQKRAELVEFLEPYRQEISAELDHPWADWAVLSQAGNAVRMPGAQSRWNAGKDQSWQPLRIELVVEVAYDHMQANRFRHTAQFRRWRHDREPLSCTYEQLDRPVAFDLAAVLS